MPIRCLLHIIVLGCLGEGSEREQQLRSSHWPGVHLQVFGKQPLCSRAAIEPTRSLYSPSFFSLNPHLPRPLPLLKGWIAVKCSPTPHPIISV